MPLIFPEAATREALLACGAKPIPRTELATTLQVPIIHVVHGEWRNKFNNRRFAAIPDIVVLGGEITVCCDIPERLAEEAKGGYRLEDFAILHRGPRAFYTFDNYRPVLVHASIDEKLRPYGCSPQSFFKPNELFKTH
jgi:hypothetical protein